MYAYFPIANVTGEQHSAQFLCGKMFTMTDSVMFSLNKTLVSTYYVY